MRVGLPVCKIRASYSQGSPPTITLQVKEAQEMAKIINCECGFVVRGSDDEELRVNLEEHIWSDHPTMVGKYDPQDLLAMAEEV